MRVPDLSFIMPVYNGRKYISEAVDSIQKTVKDLRWELLIYDDASTDRGDADIDYLTVTSNARIWYGYDRIGAAEGRNKLIANARSENLYILDCDNILVPGCVNKMFSMLSDDCKVVSTEKLIFFGNKQGVPVNGVWSFDSDKYDLNRVIKTHKTPISSGNYLYKREVWSAVLGYHKSDIQETWGFGLRHILEGYPVHVCKGTSYLHRYCDNGYYNELDKSKMSEAYRRRLISAKHKLSEESCKLIETNFDGKALVESGKLKTKEEA